MNRRFPVNKFISYSLTIFTIIPLFACQNSKKNILNIDNNSYITDFELLQENTRSNNSIKITSPRAIINQSNNDIEIFDSLIEIINEDNRNITINSGNSILDNTKNTIQVFNNVLITMDNSKDYFIRTNSFNWDLNNSNISIDNPLNIFFENTNINSLSGSYDINSNLLKINNNIFNRSILNGEGKEKFHIRILSDIAKWLKEDNSFEFKSNKKQVETTINILSTK